MLPCKPVAPPPPDCEAACPQKACHFAGIVPVSTVQNTLRTAAKVLRRFMRTDEGEEFLAFVLCKAHRGRFRTRHLRLPAMDGMRAEDGVMLPQPGCQLKSNFFLPRCTSVQTVTRHLARRTTACSCQGKSRSMGLGVVSLNWAVYRQHAANDSGLPQVRLRAGTHPLSPVPMRCFSPHVALRGAV